MKVKTKRAVVITAVVLVALLALAEKGQSLTLKAGLYDQYLRLRDVTPQFFLARDLAGGEKLYEGVTLEGATLTLSSDSPLKAGDIVTVVAEAGSKKAAAFIKVT